MTLVIYQYDKDDKQCDVPGLRIPNMTCIPHDGCLYSP
jgi:hypothetical protein